MRFLEPLVRLVAAKCLTHEVYDFYGRKVEVELSWTEMAELARQKSGRNLPVHGGLFPATRFSRFMPSFAFKTTNASYIVLVPGNWHNKMLYGAGRWLRKNKLDPHEVMCILAEHETRHLKQTGQGYGLKSAIIFPGCILGLPAVLATLALACFGIVSFAVPAWTFLYSVVALVVYVTNWRERDARNAARANWQEWRTLIHVRFLP